MTRRNGTDAAVLGWLYDYNTQRRLRPATAEEIAEAREAERWDDGLGIIALPIDGRLVPCTVLDLNRWSRPA